jgi:hypothetical protein
VRTRTNARSRGRWRTSNASIVGSEARSGSWPSTRVTVAAAAEPAAQGAAARRVTARSAAIARQSGLVGLRLTGARIDDLGGLETLPALARLHLTEVRDPGTLTVETLRPLRDCPVLRELFVHTSARANSPPPPDRQPTRTQSRES